MHLDASNHMRCTFQMQQPIVHELAPPTCVLHLKFDPLQFFNLALHLHFERSLFGFGN